MLNALDKLYTFRRPRIPLAICSLFFTEDFPIADIHLLVSPFGCFPQITAHIPFRVSWFSLFIDREEIQHPPLLERHEEVDHIVLSPPVHLVIQSVIFRAGRSFVSGSARILHSWYRFDTEVPFPHLLDIMETVFDMA